MYVYAEYLLIENIIINYIILYVTKKITKSKTANIRLFISALIGSIYTLVAFFPSLQFMGKMIIKLSISILMIIIAFNPEKLNQFLKQISAFYMVSFVFAGAIIGIFYILNNSFIFTGISFKNSDELIKFLIIGITIALVLIRYILKFYQVKIRKENFIANVSIGLNDKEVELIALIDTGNSLKEPISKKPVLIAEYRALKSILPDSIKNMYKSNQKLDLIKISEVMEEVSDDIKLRLIPFKSLGNDNGILIGFKPDKIKVYLESETKNLSDDIIVAIYNDRLASDEIYNGLLHPELLG
ncbi:stage II sporulation protein GA (sporulation sigma-E factor processing peptidase) [Keratinibaculum paraultunense]|uniref:Sporulation sigma-E factor-processing peptidase n=1 Tax=Keratinibaculum paraultunense TaxID=1278232 RepID=A0A4R3KYK8_9FIRM|nr:sigma-E processing peptidase SpoIIGA [Keratinibaculum paraultunense]QQY80545.1 sigma-E processing peptidase SpoIIGA [Keratinibaculum paraultunense]TCS91268.1 stage II sporulation protein GA (sporulation sigma-E factor processing peptidase) [Keratinibaculum paraultunense]